MVAQIDGLVEGFNPFDRRNNLGARHRFGNAPTPASSPELRNYHVVGDPLVAVRAVAAVLDTLVAPGLAGFCPLVYNSRRARKQVSVASTNSFCGLRDVRRFFVRCSAAGKGHFERSRHDGIGRQFRDSQNTDRQLRPGQPDLVSGRTAGKRRLRGSGRARHQDRD
jgi:hypothetical protein